ncbi:MAG: ABC transporter permease [Erysipelotrichaceae bacterium]|nr:ABC transporter permease [Erysipelotrichaceae bacterium]MDD3924422.1 ABC transporter permease [Erysipelotrichaceae bacterium]
MKFSLQMALRFLRSSKGQTLMIIIGIAIGVSVQIFIGSLIQGLQKSLVDTTIGNASQITITNDRDDKLIDDHKMLMDKIKTTDDDIINITAVYDSATFLAIDNESQSLLLRGFDIDTADKIYDIYDRIYLGKAPIKDNEIILGKQLQEKYDLSLNDRIDILTVDRVDQVFTVVGFFDFKVTSLNTNWGITTLTTSQTVFDSDGITAIEMQVDEGSVFEADAIAAKIAEQLYDYDLKIDNWKDANQQLLSGLQGQSVSSYMIQVFVMISVILGIASVLAITVLQKSRQVGILKAMGIKNKVAGQIFLFEGFILGFLGAVLGILFGLGLAYSFTIFAVNPDNTPVVNLYIDWRFIFISGIIAMIASTLAAAFPAIRSSRLNPIDIIRNN